jgi:hypothetical protein
VAKPNLWNLPARAVRQETREFHHPDLAEPLRLTVRELGFIGQSAAAELGQKFTEEWVLRPDGKPGNAYPCPVGPPVMLNAAACRSFAFLISAQVGPEEERLDLGDCVALATLAPALFDEISDWVAPFTVTPDGEPNLGNPSPAATGSLSAPPPEPETDTQS